LDELQPFVRRRRPVATGSNAAATAAASRSRPARALQDGLHHVRRERHQEDHGEDHVERHRHEHPETRILPSLRKA
jgi:hypothetical protein